MKKCLMIETPDKLFTHKKNLPYLLDFSKKFNIKISIAHIQDEKEILDLKELASLFCKKKTQNHVKYTLIKPNIKKHIKNQLLKGKVISIDQLSQAYKKITVYKNLNKIKNELEEEGKKLI